MKSIPAAIVLAVSVSLALAGCQQSQDEHSADSQSAASDPTAANAGSAPAGQGDSQDGANAQSTVDSGPAGGVDPEAYRGGSSESKDTFYFVTPDGTFSCAIAEDQTGCNSESMPASAPQVDASDDDAKVRPNAVSFSTSEKAEFSSTGDPMFHYLDANGEFGKGKVLPAGQKLTALGVTCSVTEDSGVDCSNGTHGFTVSTKKYTLS